MRFIDAHPPVRSDIFLDTFTFSAFCELGYPVFWRRNRYWNYHGGEVMGWDRLAGKKKRILIACTYIDHLGSAAYLFIFISVDTNGQGLFEPTDFHAFPSVMFSGGLQMQANV
ncbi:hypothetical protein M501DRAFT_223162 [Patellaria atrata CBS 101060]|uniref:Uncharacterized protein n=1 Tax=Patellaria atrata CBS 101060 TaxID=1346257 RepID=A0A9P4VPF0_9PEZI|nr:hypothetical protein M501DRAFT_223162 [Patellaria atrata CBS 101060]